MELPNVSICTPTYNRREFIKKLIKMVCCQDYPKECLQWVIVDDGEEQIEDLIHGIDFALYVKLPKKVALGEKRNIMHKYTSGSIIVYMDDDDYYPPTRVSHAVEILMSNKQILCAGCSKIYVYFSEKKKIYSFGPYHKNHATANTFAFRRELLDKTSYQDDAVMSEERHFLNDFNVSLLQLNPLKTILVISHETNTFDKRTILKHAKKSKKAMVHYEQSGFDVSDYDPKYL